MHHVTKLFAKASNYIGVISFYPSLFVKARDPSIHLAFIAAVQKF